MRRNTLLVGLIVLSFLSLVVTGNAQTSGYYEVEYSWSAGGTGAQWAIRIVGEDGNPWGRAYATSSGYYGGTDTSRNQPTPPFEPPISSGNVTCSGVINVKFTWNSLGNPTGNLPPPSVIIKETSTASWSGQSGNANNGLGHAPQGGSGGQVSTGVKYWVKNDPGQSFEFTCQPSAFASTMSIEGAEAGVSYKAETTPVWIVISGAKWTGTQYAVLWGKGVIASLVTPGFLPTSHNWSFGASSSNPPHEWFHHDSLGAGGSYHYYSGPGPGWAQEDVIQLNYYGGDGVDKVVCSAALEVNGQYIGTVVADRDLRVWKPYVFFSASDGHSVYTDDYDYNGQIQTTHFNGIEYLGTHGSPLLEAGIEFGGRVSMPALFSEYGAGAWCFAQTVDWKITRVNGPFHTVTTSESDGWELDTRWPYEPKNGSFFETSNDGVTMRTGDSPIVGVGTWPHSVETDSHFKMFIGFKPPNNSGGAGVAWVPLYRADWQWVASAVYDGGEWSDLADGVTITGYESQPTWTFSWDSIFQP